MRIRFIAQYAFSLLVLFIAGCGGGNSGTGGASSTTKLEAAASCIGCHGSAVSVVTGSIIPDEWKASAHNTQNGAGCVDCHEPKPGHPNNCNNCHNGTAVPTQDEVVRNPDAAQKCNKCHGLGFPSDAMVKNAPQHFGNLTASINNNGFRASYVSSMYVGNCRKCHNPHKPIARDAAGDSIHAQWAESGHGEPASNARKSRDFKTFGTYQPVNTTVDTFCVRCHTTTGFIKFVTSGFTDQTPFAGPGITVVKSTSTTTVNSTDKTKEATNCDACHADYSFKVRPVPQVSIYYNFSSGKQLNRGLFSTVTPTTKLYNNPRTYPDAGPSNLCIACHSGRATGELIKDAVAANADFTNITRPSGHDFPGGGTLFRKTGYEFPGRDYDSSASGFLHDKIGINNTNGTGNQGPCITCHLKSPQSHSFLPVTFNMTGLTINSIKSITGTTCASGGCHDGTARPVWDATSLQTKRFGFHSAMTILNQLLTNKGVTSSGVQYYQRSASAGNPIVDFNGNVLTTPALIIAAVSSKTVTNDNITNDWVSAVLTPQWKTATNWWNNPSGTGSALANSPITKAANTPANQQIAANTMGASFNYSMYSNEFGAYVHNDLYIRRLIYDSIDWIDDGVLNDSVATTLATPITITTGSGSGTTKTISNNTEPGTKGRIYTTAELLNITQTARIWLFGSSTATTRP